MKGPVKTFFFNFKTSASSRVHTLPLNIMAEQLHLHFLTKELFLIQVEDSKNSGSLRMLPKERGSRYQVLQHLT